MTEIKIFLFKVLFQSKFMLVCGCYNNKSKLSFNYKLILVQTLIFQHFFIILHFEIQINLVFKDKVKIQILEVCQTSS